MTAGHIQFRKAAMSMGNSYQDNLAAAARLAHVAPLGSLREKVDPGHSALLVIDMQNDFCARGGLVDKGGRDVSAVQDMARHLPALIESARKAGALVIFVRSVYTTDNNRYLSDVWLEQAARKQGGGYTQTPVCRDGSWEGDYFGDVRPSPGDIVVTKHRYNAFHKTDLDTILHAKAQLESLVSWVGAPRVLLGSDYPYDMAMMDLVRHVRSLSIPQTDKDIILGTEAAELLARPQMHAKK